MATDRLLVHQLLPRTGQPEDIANLVAFLVSDDGSFITGEAISIDGGALAHMPSYADGGNIKRAPAPAEARHARGRPAGVLQADDSVFDARSVDDRGADRDAGAR